MDIRALFRKQKEKNEDVERTAKAPVIIDEEEEDQDFKPTRKSGKAPSKSKPSPSQTPKKGSNRKRPRKKAKFIDSDEEDVTAVLPAKRSKVTSPAATKKQSAKATAASTSKQKNVVETTTPNNVKSVSDFFGAAPIKRSAAVTTATKHSVGGGKKVGSMTEVGGAGDVVEIPESPMDSVCEFDDEAVALALEEDEMELVKAKEKEVHEDNDFSKTLKELDTPSSSEISVRPAKRLKLMMEKLPIRESQTPTKQTHNGDHTPSKRGTPSKVSTPYKSGTPSKAGTPSIATRKSPRNKLKDVKIELSQVRKSSPKKVEKSKAKRAIKYIDSPLSSNRDKSEAHEYSLDVKPKLPITPQKQSPQKKTGLATPQTSLSTPKTSHYTPKTGLTTPKPATPDSSTPSSVPKPSRSDSYRQYLNRAGPKAPGSKPIPQGAPNCLEGLTFIITGVLESQERDEAASLIKSYGGKVTSSLSKKTSYVVVGDGAGESKLAKATRLGTKQIDEDGLLELIGTLPRKGTATPSTAKKTQPAKKRPKIEPSSVATKPSLTKSSSYSSASNSLLTSKMAAQSGVPGLSSVTPTLSGMASPVAKGTPPVSSVATPLPGSDSLLWVDKYKPRSTKSIIGQQGAKSNAKKLLRWLQTWETNNSSSARSGKKVATSCGGRQEGDGGGFKAALLSGPPGVGKTTTATLCCEEAGYTFVDLNASAARSKRTLHDQVAGHLGCLSIDSFVDGKVGVVSGRSHALIMDEVDGMAGNEDRGGVQELIAMIKDSKVPIICICNDRQHPKIRSLANYCFDLRFYKPKADQIKGALMSVCFKEGVKIEPLALMEIIMASGQDVRQVLHNVSLWSVSDKSLNLELAKETARNTQKHSKMGPFEIAKMVFMPKDRERELTLNEKSDLFFHDYNIAALFVQENYLSVRPVQASGDIRKTLARVSRAADSLCDGDLIEKKIRASARWELLPLQAFFSSVIPGEYMKGNFGRPVFPRWLGQNSKRGRCDRMLQELQRHTRLSASCNKTEFGMEYLPFLCSKLTAPLVTEGSDGVPTVISTMESYFLSREDWDGILELAHFPGRQEVAAQIPSKVKSAFTRTYNKSSHATPYAVTTATKKVLSKVSTSDSYENGDMGESELDSDDNSEDISSNPMIRVNKSEGVEPKKKGVGSTGTKGKASSHGNSKKGKIKL